MRLKNLTTMLSILAAIFVISILNSSITGNVVSDVTGEFPGMGIFLIIILGAVGLFMIKGIHSKK